MNDLLPKAIALLHAAGSTSFGGQPADGHDQAQLLNDWLEATATADLVAKAHDIAACIQLAGPPPDLNLDGELSRLLVKPWRKADAAALDAHRQRLSERCHQLHGQLVSHASTPGGKAPRSPAATAAAALDPAGLAALDQLAADTVFGEEFVQCEPPLSTAVRSAFKHRRVIDVRQQDRVVLQVGASGWTARLLAMLEDRRIQIASLDLREEVVPALKPVVEQLHALLTAARAVQATDADVVRRLCKLLDDDGALLHALNEVRALLTPARWAYPELSAKASLDRAPSIELRDEDEVRAAHRLNTAELNTLGLAFFLLGARRVANPLRLLVLDDPLQNMDELTVTTVARGMGRMLRLWAQLDAQQATQKTGDASIPWQVLLLLHGEDDVERFRDEVPCTCYRLPWLVPSEPGKPPGERIFIAGSRLDSKHQNLAPFIEPLPPLP